MKKSFILFTIIFAFLLSLQVHAGSIYSWTDGNGIKRYSNTQPSEETEHVEIIEEMPHDGRISDKNQERHRSIMKLKDRNQASEAERKKKEEKREAAKAEEKANAKKEIAEKVRAEKNRLLEEIKRYERLAVTPTFSLALKNSIIKRLKDKITHLEQSPEAYFENKDE